MFIRSGETQPITAYEKNSVKTVVHFGKDSPRPDIKVMVVSTMSTNTLPVKNLTFQAAVPKVSSSPSNRCTFFCFLFKIIMKKTITFNSWSNSSSLHLHYSSKHWQNANFAELIYENIWTFLSVFCCLLFWQTMRVKLQPASAENLPAFNPILPAAAITQVMLLANPQKVCTTLSWKMGLAERHCLSFTLINFYTYSLKGYVWHWRDLLDF